MSTATQQTTYTTGLSVTATILNNEFNEIYTNINKVYTFIDDSSGSGVVEVDTGSSLVGIGKTPDTQLHKYLNSSDADNTNALRVEQDGTGDAAIDFLLTGARRYLVGIDNSASDDFKIVEASSDGLFASHGGIGVNNAGKAIIYEHDRDNNGSATTQDVFIQSGWVQKAGTGSTTMSKAVTFPTAFSSGLVRITVNYLGVVISGSASDETDPTGSSIIVNATDVTSTGFNAFWATLSGNLGAANSYAISWIAIGPK